MSTLILKTKLIKKDKQHRNKKNLIQKRIRWYNNWKITEKSQEAEHLNKKCFR